MMDIELVDRKLREQRRLLARLKECCNPDEDSSVCNIRLKCAAIRKQKKHCDRQIAETLEALRRADIFTRQAEFQRELRALHTKRLVISGELNMMTTELEHQRSRVALQRATRDGGEQLFRLLDDVKRLIVEVHVLLNEGIDELLKLQLTTNCFDQEFYRMITSRLKLAKAGYPLLREITKLFRGEELDVYRIMH
jgi:hypothetical protein